MKLFFYLSIQFFYHNKNSKLSTGNLAKPRSRRSSLYYICVRWKGACEKESAIACN